MTTTTRATELLASAELPELVDLVATTPVEVDVARRIIRARILPPPGVVGTASVGGRAQRVRFAAQALTWPADVTRVKYLIEHDRERVAGHAVAIAYAADGGLDGEFKIAEGELGDTALREAKAKTRDGVSPGAFDLTGSYDSAGVLDVSAGFLRETSQVSIPAFDDARITDVAAARPTTTTSTTERNPMKCQTCGKVHAEGVTTCEPSSSTRVESVSASAIAAELRDLLASGELIIPTGGGQQPEAGTGGGQQRTGLDLFAMAELVVDAQTTGVMSDELRAALADVVPANAPNAFRPAYLDELWEGSDYVRKYIDNATVTRPLPRTMKLIGHRWVTKPLVDDYAGDKGAVPSGPATLEDVPVDVKRLAGANDVDRAYFDLGSPEWLASYWEACTESYRKQSDQRAATTGWNGATQLNDNDATPLTFPTLLEGVVAGIVDLANIGEGADYVAMAPGLVAELLNITAMEAPAFFGGSFQLGQQGDGQLGGLTFFTTPGLPAGGFMVGRKTAQRWHEFEPPVKVQAQNIGQGGVDLGIFGYYATYTRNAAQVRKATVGA